MTSTPPRKSDSLSSCSGLTQELSQSLLVSQGALLTYDLAKFESQTVRQGELCSALRREYDAGNGSSAELMEAQAGLLRQARFYGALLRRVRRTVEIFGRVLASSEVTYASPRANTRR